jgi:hypothetical protein
MDCQWFGDEPGYQLALDLSAGGPREFVLSTDQITRYVDSNFHWFGSAAELRKQYERACSRQYSAAAVALLAYSTKPEADAMLGVIVWKGDRRLQLKATRALARRGAWSDESLAAANYALACANAGMCSNPEALTEASLKILRNAEGGRTRTSDAAAQLDASRAVRRLVTDLGSDYSALRVYAARQLGRHGEEAAPAIPFLRAALDDEEYDFKPWSDSFSVYDFSTVADAARATLQELDAEPEQ